MKIKALILSLVVLLAIAVPVLGCACELVLEQQWTDGDVERTFDTECTICLVEVKSATNLYEFDADGCESGYCVEGIGSGSGRVYENSPAHDISHVNWYVDCETTSVSMVGVEVNSDGIWWIAVLAVFVLLVAVVVAWFATMDN